MPNLAYTSQEPITTTPEECRAAFAEVAAEIAAIPDAALVPITLDITTAVTVGLGAAPKLEALRPELRQLAGAEQLPRQVRVTALALMHAHGIHQTFVEPEEPFARRIARAQELRARFSSDISAMINRGVVDPDAMDDYRGTVGYKVLVNDLTIAIQVIRSHWNRVSGRTFVTGEELAEAERLVTQLLADIGKRDQGSLHANEAALTRQRAFTLFVNTYAEARRSVQYVRFHEGDADLTAPSLYAGRGNGNHRSADDTMETPAEPEAETTTAAPAADAQPTAADLPSAAAEPADAVVAGASAPTAAATTNGSTGGPFVP